MPKALKWNHQLLLRRLQKIHLPGVPAWKSPKSQTYLRSRVFQKTERITPAKRQMQGERTQGTEALFLLHQVLEADMLAVYDREAYEQ